MERQDWKGNDGADAEAKKGARAHGEGRLANILVRMTEALHSTQNRILMRICGGEELQPQEGTSQERRRAPNKARGIFIGPIQAEEVGQHRVTVGESTITCRDCNITRKGLNKALWAKFPCQSQRGRSQLSRRHDLEGAGEKWKCKRCKCQGWRNSAFKNELCQGIVTQKEEFDIGQLMCKGWQAAKIKAQEERDWDVKKADKRFKANRFAQDNEEVEGEGNEATKTSGSQRKIESEGNSALTLFGFKRKREGE